MARSLPDGTYQAFECTPIFHHGPENVLEVCLCDRCKIQSRGIPKAPFLVIAAPRPSGLPDLELIQAGTSRGALFFGAGAVLGIQSKPDERSRTRGVHAGRTP